MAHIEFNKALKKIGIHVSDGIQFRNVSELMYCQSEENYSRLIFKCGKEYLVSKTLKDLELNLSHFNTFFRIHKKSLINLDYMAFYKKDNGNCFVILEDNTCLDVACRRRNELLKQILKV